MKKEKKETGYVQLTTPGTQQRHSLKRAGQKVRTFQQGWQISNNIPTKAAMKFPRGDYECSKWQFSP